MKETELRRHSTCSLCHRKIGESGLPMFWRVTVERFGIDTRALRRQTGLEMMLGNVALAQVFSADETMAVPVMEPHVVTVCEDCCTKSTCVAALAPRADDAGRQQHGLQTGEGARRRGAHHLAHAAPHMGQLARPARHAAAGAADTRRVEFARHGAAVRAPRAESRRRVGGELGHGFGTAADEQRREYAASA